MFINTMIQTILLIFLMLTTPRQVYAHYINAQKCVKYDVDIINVVPLSEKYYAKKPTKKLRDFFDYIRAKKDKVNVWNGKEKDFVSIIDELTVPVSQKNLSRFYTPERYSFILKEYVLNAIKEV